MLQKRSKNRRHAARVVEVARKILASGLKIRDERGALIHPDQLSGYTFTPLNPDSSDQGHDLEHRTDDRWGPRTLDLDLLLHGDDDRLVWPRNSASLAQQLCASNNLVSVANPVLSMVSSPAGYRGLDLLRVGGPLSVAYVLVVIAVVNLLY